MRTSKLTKNYLSSCFLQTWLLKKQHRLVNNPNYISLPFPLMERWKSPFLCHFCMEHPSQSTLAIYAQLIPSSKSNTSGPVTLEHSAALGISSLFIILNNSSHMPYTILLIIRDSMACTRNAPFLNLALNLTFYSTEISLSAPDSSVSRPPMGVSLKRSTISQRNTAMQ